MVKSHEGILYMWKMCRVTAWRKMRELERYFAVPPPLSRFFNVDTEINGIHISIHSHKQAIMVFLRSTA